MDQKYCKILLCIFYDGFGIIYSTFLCSFMSLTCAFYIVNMAINMCLIIHSSSRLGNVQPNKGSISQSSYSLKYNLDEQLNLMIHPSMIDSLTHFTEQMSKKLDTILPELQKKYLFPSKIKGQIRSQICEIKSKPQPSLVLEGLPKEEQNGSKPILYVQLNQNLLPQSKDLKGNNGEPSIFKQLNIENEEQQKQIKRLSKKAKVM